MEAPQYQQLQGSGDFSAPAGSFSSEFLLLRNPYWMGVLATTENSRHADLTPSSEATLKHQTAVKVDLLGWDMSQAMLGIIGGQGKA